MIKCECGKTVDIDYWDAETQKRVNLIDKLENIQDSITALQDTLGESLAEMNKTRPQSESELIEQRLIALEHQIKALKSK